MLKVSIKLLILVIIITGLTESVHSKDNFPREYKYLFSENKNLNPSDSINIEAIKWPIHYSIQQTGKINAVFDDGGHFGTGFSNYTVPGRSFETPAYSGHQYLYAGAIWVGGTVDGDTLVSVSADGWSSIVEFGLENIQNPRVKKIPFPSDYSVRTEFTDTVTDGIPNDPISGMPHSPLNIKITNRSHVWRNAPYNDGIFYDFLIDYFGPADSLEEVYIGFYFDCDVLSITGPDSPTGHTDDLAGSLKESGIAYIIDNDGDPVQGSFDEHSPRKTFAFELLATSFTPTDTNFNWWVSSGNSLFDFGPRLKGTPEDPFRDFGTGGIGTPEGDANKYYIMSHKEWDYDQVMVASIDSTDPDWMAYDPTLTSIWADGVDSRFLFSFGPFNLVKGKSERFIFSTFTADSIHVDPTNLDNLPDNPDLFNANLNLENIITVGSDIRQVLDIILNPIVPPTGLEIYDSNQIKFDQWCFDNVTGHELYATPVDASTFPFPGVIPPWYIPETPIQVGTSIFEVPLVAINGLTAINVSHNSNSGTGKLSGTEYINGINKAIPIIKPQTTSTTQDSIVFEWTLPVNATQPDYYKIYRYTNIDDFNNNYRKPYYLEGGGDSFTQDSVLVNSTWWFYQTSKDSVYSIVNGSELQFIDYNFIDGYLYYFVSVDENGLDADYALSGAYLIPERTIDFLIVTKSRIPSIPTNADTIINFYTELLDTTEMSYDIYSVADSIGNSDCADDSLANCPDWQTMSKYKYVVIDDGEFTKEYWTLEIIEYLQGGGNLITFGALPNLLGVSAFGLPAWYANNSNNYDYRIFGVDSIFHAGFAYNLPDPIENGKFGFNLAMSVDQNFSDLECDTSRYPLDSVWITIANHPTNEPPEVSGFVPSANAVVTHKYKSLYPTTSYLEDLPVGVMHNWNDSLYSYDVYTYGFHLYYMKYDHARDLLRSILLSTPNALKEFTELNNENLPTEFSISQNYPNPFNPSTTIEFSVPARTNVTLKIYNLLGQQVKELVNQEYATGNYRVEWDGTNITGEKVSSGIYLYRIESDSFSSTKKMILLK